MKHKGAMLNYAGDAGDAGDGITQDAAAWRMAMDALNAQALVTIFASTHIIH